MFFESQGTELSTGQLRFLNAKIIGISMSRPDCGFAALPLDTPLSYTKNRCAVLRRNTVNRDLAERRSHRRGRKHDMRSARLWL